MYFSAIIATLFCMSLNFSHATEIIGHRGASQDAPENTL
jgi:glycerophosphoryl diester phosphodiesterase